MATIKSFTSLEQSKKLAEILSIECADMYYNLGESNIPNVIYGNHDDFKCYLPCWSLAALLKLIPNFNMFKRTIECKIETTNHSIDKACDLVDAAFEMVCWLKENNKYEKEIIIMKELSIEGKEKAYDEAIEINPTEFDTRLQALIGKFDSLPKEKLIGSLSFWMNVVQNDGTYKSDEKQGEQDNNEDSNILQRFSFYSYKDEPNVLYLAGLYVNEEYRNKGIGTKILKVADEVAVSMKCNSIRLKTEKGSHAEKLYRENGYTTILGEEENQIWLEKKDEQKFADKVEPRFEVGDWVVYCGKTCKITELHNGIFTITNQDGSYFFNQVESTTEPVFHLWTIQDAKDGDVLVDEDNNIGIYKEIEGICWHSYIYLGCDNRLYGFSIGGSHTQNNTKPATKEQRELLFQKMKESGRVKDILGI